MNTTLQLALLTLAQTDAAPGAAPASQVSGRSALQFIAAGGPISYLLVTLSFVALALIVANVLVLRRERLLPLHVQSGLENLLAQRQVAQAVRFCQTEENQSFLASIVGGGLSKAAKSPYGMLDLKTAIEDAGSREVERLERINHWIGIIAAVGPMLGLLGTVFGMIGAFATIGSLSGVQRSQELSTYMSLALVATAEGLIVAIPCTVAFAVFRRRIEAIATEAGDVAERLVAPVMSQAAAPPPRLPAGPSGVPGGPLARPAVASTPPAAVAAATVPLAPARGNTGSGNGGAAS